jgi:glycosyltransferase involved in cell wall biosynthesis
MHVVSVIIPVFNAQLHLKKCIESLLLQTQKSCEFIFINDGSTDASKTIIADFQKLDSRIVLINQDNQGVSAARNAGLQIAKGKFIGFVDADDTIESNYFQRLLETAATYKVDIVIAKYTLVQKDKKSLSTTNFPENKVLDSEFIQNKIIPHLMQFEDVNAIWNKFFSAELLQKNDIKFPIGVALGEDGLFNMQAFHQAKSVYFADFAGYNYMEIDGSATRSFATNTYFHHLKNEYQQDFSMYQNKHLTAEKISKLKAKKFLTKAISLLHEYTNPINKLGKEVAYKRVVTLLNDATFTKILHENYNEITAGKGRYEKFIFCAAKNKWIHLLFIATSYSRLRNK